MKTTLVALLFLVSSTWAVLGQIGETKYVGKVEVPNLGTVTFPPGEWYLEFRQPPPHRPDYFGFRKVSETAERLGFYRYTPAEAPAQLYHLLDGIAETLDEGAPPELLKRNGANGTSYPMRCAPMNTFTSPETKDIFYSFIGVQPGRPLNWLCHAHLFSSDGWVFVVFHAAPSVLDPETIENLDWRPSKPPS